MATALTAALGDGKQTVGSFQHRWCRGRTVPAAGCGSGGSRSDLRSNSRRTINWCQADLARPEFAAQRRGGFRFVPQSPACLSTGGRNGAPGERQPTKKWHSANASDGVEIFDRRITKRRTAAGDRTGDPAQRIAARSSRRRESDS